MNQITINELEPLLQQYLNDEELKIIELEAKNLLPLGENFASVMLKLDVKVRKKNDMENTELHLVKKGCVPTEEFAIAWPSLMRREVFIYSELMNAYRDIEREAGVEEIDLIDVIPEFIGYKNSSTGSNEIDVNSFFVMENLTKSGYYTLDRRVGIDVNHAKTALTSLARFHALGVFLIQNRPDLAKRAIEIARRSARYSNFVEKSFQVVRSAFSHCSELQRYLPELEAAIERCKNMSQPKQPWATITHGDFWTNNLLFNGDRVKFVDFQLYSYESPLREVAFFLCNSLDVNAQENHAVELLDMYRKTFKNTLRKVGCDDGAYEDFEAELKRVALLGFVQFSLAAKFSVFEIREEDRDNKELYKSVYSGEVSEAYKNRLLRLIDFYKARGWFC